MCYDRSTTGNCKELSGAEPRQISEKFGRGKTGSAVGGLVSLNLRRRSVSFLEGWAVSSASVNDNWHSVGIPQLSKGASARSRMLRHSTPSGGFASYCQLVPEPLSPFRRVSNEAGRSKDLRRIHWNI